jgi:chemotaxis family two-component system response regulator Rcp1
MLSISSAEADISKAYHLYANCYIVKPLNLDQFSNVVKTIEDFWLTLAELPSENGYDYSNSAVKNTKGTMESSNE